jgi:hypothetical protein
MLPYICIEDSHPNIYIYKVVVVVVVVCLYVFLSVYMYSHNSDLDGRRQKVMGALNSDGIGEGAKLNKISKSFPLKLMRSGKSSKMMKI